MPVLSALVAAVGGEAAEANAGGDLFGTAIVIDQGDGEAAAKATGMIAYRGVAGDLYDLAP